MPQGWETTNDGLERNLGVSNQHDAKVRGGGFYLNKEEKRLDWVMSQDGSGRVLSMRPVLDAGVTHGPFVEKPFGWNTQLSDGTKLWLIDFQSTKVANVLPDIKCEGMGFVIGSIPISQVPQTGIWEPEEIRFFGSAYDDCGFYIQEKIPGDLSAVYPDGHIGSISIFSESAPRIDIPGRRYMGGKYGQVYAVMVGWKNGQATGFAYGSFRDMGGGHFKKRFDMDAILAAGDMTRNGIGNPTTVSVSVDVGFTSMGGLSTSDGTFAWITAPITSPLNGECTKLVCGFASSGLGVSWDVALYTGASGNADTIITENVNSVSDSAVMSGGGWWNTKDVGAGVAPVTNGGLYRVAFDRGSIGSYRFDFPGPAPGHDRITHTAATSFPDPIGAPPSSRTSTLSAYITVEPTAPAGPSIPVVMHHRQQQRSA